MNSVTKTTFYIFIITIFSKILGFCREISLTYIYGATSLSDVYIISTSIPNILFASILGSLSTTFIPLFHEIENDSEEKSLYFTNNIFNITIFISIVIIILSILFTKPLVKLFAIDFMGDKLELAIRFTKIIIFGVIFIGLNNILASYLQIKGKFLIPNMVGFPYNIIVILTIILSSFTNSYIMIIGALFGLLFQFVFLFYFSKKQGYKYKFYVNFKDKYLIKMIILMIPVFIGSSVNQVNSIIDRSLASTLDDGYITILNSANRLNSFFMGIFITAISSTVYPILSKLSINNKKDEFGKTIINVISIVIVLMVPVSIFVIVLSEPIVKFVFERGAFDSYDTKMTAIALSCYALGIVAFSLRDILGRIFYSVQDTKTPMVNGFIAVLINILLNLILIDILGYVGLAISTSISALVCILLLFRSLNKRFPNFRKDIIIKNFVKSLLSSFIAGYLLYFIYHFISESMIENFIYQGISLVVPLFIAISFYLILCCLLKIDIVINLIRRRRI